MARERGPRVVVTGLGQVSAAGPTLDLYERAVFEARSGIRRLPDLRGPGHDDPVGAALSNFDPDRWPLRPTTPASRATRYAYAAASQAFDQARLERVERRRGGVFVGTGFGGQAESEDTYKACFETPGTRPRPSVIPAAMANGSAGVLATEFLLKGENATLAVACASGTHAIGYAYRALQRGALDVALAVGTDAPLTPIVLAAWNAMRVLAPADNDPARACRPFSADRAGLVLGEGAGALVLETAEHANARGADTLAEIMGYGANADAGHITNPSIDGVAACLELALSDAGTPLDLVGYVNAHGTGTIANDRTETEALARVFGAHGRGLLVSSTKPIHGHAMGASGALEAIATVLALERQLVPPTAGTLTVDPTLPALGYVTGEARPARFDVAMSSSFAFGGNNAVIVLRTSRAATPRS
jgi:3-oxoacyl-(acyl-carrier-protein) synthase